MYRILCDKAVIAELNNSITILNYTRSRLAAELCRI